MPQKEYPEEIQKLIKTVVDHFDNEDKAVRERQIRTWRKLKLFWDGFQRIYYSEVAHDWRVPDNLTSEVGDQEFYDRPINIYKAYLESIISALSVTVPPIKCYPDDADNPLDIATAHAGDKIAELVFRHNDAPLLWLHALFIYCTEGMTACYNYTKSDESYGTYEEKKFEDYQESYKVCPMCQKEMVDENFTEDKVDDAYNPDNESVPLTNMLGEGTEPCPNCSAMINPEIQNRTASRLVGIINHPKSRQCMEVYGGLYVKVPVYAMKQADIPYLIFSYESHYSNVIEKYPHLRDKLAVSAGRPAGAYSAYEQWGRLNTQYQGEYPINNVTCRNVWLRPCAFNILDEDEAEILKKEFPDGVRCVYANETYAEAENESLDDCWTLTHNPLSDYLHHEPIGMLLTSVQEITNDLISLTLQTIEHGIPQTFADPSVLNFDAYRQTEVRPGDIYPARPKSGSSVGDAFYEIKTSTLSQEIMPFGNNIQTLGQLASGAQPTIFGGQLGETRTASEYSMSRAQSLQRLQNTWKVLTIWWKDIFGKVIPAYIKTVQEDERNVEVDVYGNFVNSFIRRSELEGKLGRVELEANENLPMTWQQKKDVVMELLKSGIPELLEIMGAPDNIPVIREAIGLVDFHIPGEADREKQLEEIRLLVVSEPIVMPPDENMMMQAMMSGQDPNQIAPQELPSIQIEAEIDDNRIHFDTCRVWAVGPEGRLAKIEKPEGYKNVILHAQAHLQYEQMKAMQMAMAQAQQGAAPNAIPPEPTGGAPIQGEENVPIAQ